jgi:hypothetical protein
MGSFSVSITWGPTASTTATEVVVPRLRSSSTGCRKGSYFPWCEALPPTPTSGPGGPPTSPRPTPRRQSAPRCRRSPGPLRSTGLPTRTRPRRGQGRLDTAGGSPRPPERTAMDAVTSPRRRARPGPARRPGVGGLRALPYQSRADPQPTEQPDVRFPSGHSTSRDTASGHSASRSEQRRGSRCARLARDARGSWLAGGARLACHGRGGRCRQGPSSRARPCAGRFTRRRRIGGRGRSATRSRSDDAQPRASSHRWRADRRRGPRTRACSHTKRRTASRYSGSVG